MTETTTTPTRSPRWLGALALGALLLACIGGAFAILGGGAEDGPSSIEAEVMCERFVRDRLKAPATAEFPKPTTRQAGLTFTVAGQVDAENSFGATLRTAYVCIVTADEAGAEWTLDSLTGLD